MEAIANPPAYTRARAAVRYDDVARTLVHALKYQDRTDLAPDLVKAAVRTGISVMPFFRKTEVSDADLDALAAYLAEPKKK